MKTLISFTALFLWTSIAVPVLAAGNCETEDKSGAEVCLSITNVDLDCDESFLGNYYDDCTVRLDYELTTDYKGRHYLDVDVECRVGIEYSGRHTFGSSSASKQEDESHDLYANDSTSETLRFRFSFSSFEEVTRVRIRSTTCEIDSIDLY